MRLSIIAAVARNRVIGRDNTLPWHIPEDLRYFREVTMGKPVIMGRMTFQSIGRPLPCRANIVATRDPGFPAGGIILARSSEDALEAARASAHEAGVEEAFVIGGSGLFRRFLPLADRLYLTRIDADIAGDTLFPEIDERDWKEAWHRNGDPGSPVEFPYSFHILGRR